MSTETLKPIGPTSAPVLSNSSPLWKTCYLCGRTNKPEEQQFAEEHVVAKELFAPNYPARYPAKLRVCPSCHDLKTHNEQYVNQVFRMTTFSKSGVMSADKVVADLANGHRVGLVKSLLGSTFITEVVTADGLYLGDAPAIKADDYRVHDYACTIAKGLWTAYIQEPMEWARYTCRSQYAQGFRTREVFQHPCYENMRKMASWTERWGDIFAYQATQWKDIWSLWFLSFYDTHLICVAIAHNDRHELMQELVSDDPLGV